MSTDRRPEVIAQLLGALDRLDPAGLLDVTATHQPTREEFRAAQLLHLEGMDAARPHRDREFEALELIISGGAPWPAPPTWGQAFDELDAETVARLQPLYWDMPEGARAEYDRRYGRPVTEGES